MRETGFRSLVCASELGGCSGGTVTSAYLLNRIVKVITAPERPLVGGIGVSVPARVKDRASAPVTVKVGGEPS